MGKSRYPKPIIPLAPAKFEADSNDPIDRLIVKAEAAFEKVSYFPDQSPSTWMDMITLRNLVPELARELKYLDGERKKRPSSA